MADSNLSSQQERDGAVKRIRALLVSKRVGNSECAVAEVDDLRSLLDQLEEARRDSTEISAAQIEAGVSAFRKTTAYWAPELMGSEEHLAKLVGNILDAAMSALPEGGDDHG